VREHENLRENVREGQEEQLFVVRPDGKRLQQRSRLREQRAVAQRDAARRAGSARRIDDRREVLGLSGGSPEAERSRAVFRFDSSPLASYELRVGRHRHVGGTGALQRSERFRAVEDRDLTNRRRGVERTAHGVELCPSFENRKHGTRVRENERHLFAGRRRIDGYGDGAGGEHTEVRHRPLFAGL
jgi:hypothetical protein